MKPIKGEEMIELEEKRIHIIQFQEVSMELICDYYKEADHGDTVLLIFDESRYITNISYDEVSRCYEDKELMYFLTYIYRNKHVNNSSDMFEQAKLIFEKNRYVSYILLKDSINSGKAFFYHTIMDNENYQNTMGDVYRALKKKGINIFMVRVPDKEEIKTEKKHDEWGLGFFSAPINWSKSRERSMQEYLYKITDFDYADAKENILYKKAETYGKESKTIFLVGPCIVAGWENCIGESLFEILNECIVCSELQYQLKKVIVEETPSAKLNVILEHDIRQNDIVIWITDCMDRNMADLDLTNIYNQYNGDRWLYTDVPVHTTKTGNEEIVSVLMKHIIMPVAEKSKEANSQTVLHTGNPQLTMKEQDDLFLYIENVKENTHSQRGTIGACVMTCNPFTKGHYHLINYASKQVDSLYVFVVEEDSFLFSFSDRIEMVRRGTAALGNVIVVPSGQFIISRITFRSYFEKETHPEVIINAAKDVMIFNKYIAPALNISKRFVGEEQKDFVTAQYNRLLKEKIGGGVVDVIEIPRKKINDEIISASKVRGYMEEGNWTEIEKMVPYTTLKYLTTVWAERKYEYLGNVGKDKNIDLLVHFIQSHEKIVICGMGMDMQRMMWQLDWNINIEDYENIIYYDKKIGLQNRLYRGREVIGIEELDSYKDYYFVISSKKNRIEIYYDLTQKGIAPEHIFVLGEVA